MASDLRQEYLDLKYSYINGDVDTKPKKKAKKKVPKKADHKHIYQNVIIEYTYDKNYPVQRLAGKPGAALESYCTVCGKLNCAVQDPIAEKLFPHIHVGYFGFLVTRQEPQDESEAYRAWAMKHYPHYAMPDYDSVKWRSGQTFIDIDKIIPAEIRS